MLLFERVSSRLREAGSFHPTAHAETVVSGAFILASAGVLVRLAGFIWALYSLPLTAFASVVWRYGTPRALHELSERDRTRIHPAYTRGEQFARFSDMEAVDAFRFLSRAGELPERLSVRWSAGHRRTSCTHVPKIEKLGLSPTSAASALTQAATDARETDDGSDVAPASTPVFDEHVRPSWRWAAGVPHVNGKPLCFLHLQGPAAKTMLFAPLLMGAGLVEP